MSDPTGICVSDGCGSPVFRKKFGLCTSCYRKMRADNPDRPSCEVEGCPRRSESQNGMCTPHRRKVARWGSTENAPGRGSPGKARKRQHSDGARVSSNGYRLVQHDTTVGRGLWILEHRYVMEQHLGRQLGADESVHHKNGNKLDNRIENLELWSRFQPTGQRVEDLVFWAREILRRYEPVS